MADPDVLQRRILAIEPDVLIVHARRLDDLQPSIVVQLVHDVRRHIVDDQIHRALAQLEATHHLVGDDLHDQAGVFRRAVEVVTIGLQARSCRPRRI